MFLFIIAKILFISPLMFICVVVKIQSIPNLINLRSIALIFIVITRDLTVFKISILYLIKISFNIRPLFHIFFDAAS